MASREGHTQTVNMLLGQGALVNYQDNVRTKNYVHSLSHYIMLGAIFLQQGQAPLHHASHSGHDETVTVLLENKSKVDLQDKVSGENYTPVTQLNLFMDVGRLDSTFSCRQTRSRQNSNDTVESWCNS